MKMCPGCGHPHPPQDECVHHVLDSMAALIKMFGTRARCKGCGVDIWFLTLPNGKKRPYTIHGLPHTQYCEKQDKVRAQSKQTPLSGYLEDVAP